jgi:hypothetical protein
MEEAGVLGGVWGDRWEAVGTELTGCVCRLTVGPDTSATAPA